MKYYLSLFTAVLALASSGAKAASVTLGVTIQPNGDAVLGTEQQSMYDFQVVSDDATGNFEYRLGDLVNKDPDSHHIQVTSDGKIVATDASGGRFEGHLFPDNTMHLNLNTVVYRCTVQTDEHSAQGCSEDAGEKNMFSNVAVDPASGFVQAVSVDGTNINTLYLWMSQLMLNARISG